MKELTQSQLKPIHTRDVSREVRLNRDARNLHTDSYFKLARLDSWAQLESEHVVDGAEVRADLSRYPLDHLGQ